MSENKEIQTAFEKWVKSCNGDIKLVELTNPSLIKAFIAGYKACHNEAPTGKTQELIERINDTLKYYKKWYKMAEGGLIELPAGCLSVNIEVLSQCKAQLAAQADEIKRLREGLKQILDAEYFVITIRDIAKQLLNNEV